MSNYALDVGKEHIDFCLGYDEGFCAFWMFVQDHSRSHNGEDFFLFHNINDIPGVRMTLVQVRVALAKFGIGLPKDLLLKLIQDALQGGYSEYLVENGLVHEAQEFARTVDDIRAGKWELMGTAPLDWWGNGKHCNPTNQSKIRTEWVLLLSLMLAAIVGICLRYIAS